MLRRSLLRLWTVPKPILIDFGTVLQFLNNFCVLYPLWQMNLNILLHPTNIPNRRQRLMDRHPDDRTEQMVMFLVGESFLNFTHKYFAHTAAKAIVLRIQAASSSNPSRIVHRLYGNGSVLSRRQSGGKGHGPNFSFVQLRRQGLLGHTFRERLYGEQRAAFWTPS